MAQLQFNTVVSAAMKLLNLLSKIELASSVAPALLCEGYSILLRLLAPITPHITHHLWIALGFGGDILSAGWPEVDQTALHSETMTLAVQVNGKLRAQIIVSHDASQAVIEQTALADFNVVRHLAGKSPIKMIVVPKKLVNIVVRA
jgi:leucyl-tRNA synthetase